MTSISMRWSDAVDAQRRETDVPRAARWHLVEVTLGVWGHGRPCQLASSRAATGPPHTTRGTR